jgi:hypothetical protein
MVKTIIYVVIAAVIIVGVWHWFGSSGPVPASQVVQTTTPSKTTAARTYNQPVYKAPNPVVLQKQLQQQTQNGVVTPPTVYPADQSFVINASDSGADLTSITVPKGIRVTLTINVSANGAGHGGLDFRSPIVNTNTIAPGGTVITGFMADKPFVITPYWPATNTATPYKITINIQ